MIANPQQQQQQLETKEFGYPAPIVLTPSEASESGICSNGGIIENSEFQFPSPPKPAPIASLAAAMGEASITACRVDVTDGHTLFSNSMQNSPARSTRSTISQSSSIGSSLAASSTGGSGLNAELSAKLARRLTKIERIESGVDKAFEKNDLRDVINLETPLKMTPTTPTKNILFSTEQTQENNIEIMKNSFETTPTGSIETEQKKPEVNSVPSYSLLPTITTAEVPKSETEVFKLPMVSRAGQAKRADQLMQMKEEVPSVEVIWDNDMDSSMSRNPIPEPITPIKTPTSMMHSDSDADSTVFETKSIGKSPHECLDSNSKHT